MSDSPAKKGSGKSHGPAQGPTPKPDPGPHFSLSFIEGRALVGYTDRPVTPWLRVERLTLEVPDVRFPFDVTGGAQKFRHRRLRLVELAFEADEAELARRVCAALPAAAEGLADLQIACARGFVEVAGTVAAGHLDGSGGRASAPGARVPFTLKIAADAVADRSARLVLYDARIYGPSTLPPVLLPVALLRAVAKSDLPVEAEAPLAIRLDPIPEFLNRALVRHGWKRPDFRAIRLTRMEVAPGRVALVWDAGQSREAMPRGPARERLLSALEGSRAFAAAEAAIAEGRLAEARRHYQKLEGPLPEHPFAVERILGLLLSDPATLDAALDVAEAALARDPHFVPALWALAVGRMQRGEGDAARPLLALAREAAEAGEILGALHAAEAAGREAEAAGDLDLAIEAYEVARAVQEDRLPAVRALARLHAAAGHREEALRLHRRLLGLTRDAEEQARAHAEVGRLLAEGGDLVSAKLHFDAALRCDAGHARAWLGLGRACARGGEALRAVRCLDRGRELLLSEGRRDEAAKVAFEIGRLWEEEAEHAGNALLRYREVLEHDPGHLGARVRYARISEALGHAAEAEEAWRALLDQARASSHAAATEDGLAEEAMRAPVREAHLALARISMAREAFAEAAAHFEAAERRLDPEAEAPERLEILDGLLRAYRALNRPASLARVLLRSAKIVDDDAVAVQRLAEAAERFACELGQEADARSALAAASERLQRVLDEEAARSARVVFWRAAVRVAEARGDVTSQIEALERLAEAEADPDEAARTYLELGRLRANARDDAPGALEAFAKARALAQAADLGLEAARLHLALARS
ncbi:MAG: hypothetical protein D6729_19855, partial [Deltaproteobacteria bacterium]